MKRKFILFDPKPAEGGGGTNTPPVEKPESEATPETPEEEPPPPEQPPAEPKPGEPRTVINKPPGEEEKPIDDPMLKTIMGHYDEAKKSTGEPDPEIEIKPATEDKPAEEKPAEAKKEEKAATPPATEQKPPAEQKPAKKPARKTIVTPEVEKILEPEAKPPVTVVESPAQPVEDEETKYVRTLPPEAQDELQEAAVAEQILPSRKGFRSELVKYFKRFETETGRLAQQNGGTLDTSSQEYLALEAARPRLAIHEAKKVSRHIGAEEATKATRAEVEPKLQVLEREQRRIELEPKFDNFAKTHFAKGIRKFVLDDDKSAIYPAIKLVEDGKVDEAKTSFPLETRVAIEEGQHAQRRVKQFLLLRDKAVEFNPEHARLSVDDPRRVAHDDQVYVMQLIEDEGKYMEQHGGTYKTRDGRQYLRRSEFIKVLQANPEEAQQWNKKKWTTKSYWTDTDDAVVDIIAIHAKKMAEFRVKNAQEAAERDGFQRRQVPASAQPTTVPDKKEITPPKTRVTPQPGAIEKPKKPSNQNGDVNDVLEKNYGHIFRKAS